MEAEIVAAIIGGVATIGAAAVTAFFAVRGQRHSHPVRAADAGNVSALDGTLLRGSGDAIYVVQDGRRRWIPDVATFQELGYDWTTVRQVPDQALQDIPRAAPVSAHKAGHLTAKLLFDH